MVGHEVVGERFQVACELVKVNQPMIVKVRDDDVFWIARHVDHLKIVQFRN